MIAPTTRAPERLGIGILGAGPVTQAIHLPTLARMTDRFHVAVVMDVDTALAERVAARAGARATTSQEEVLAAPDVDVVLICSPPQFHAAQVEAACAAGVRAILCEKPFATSQGEAAAIARTAAESGVPVIVGAMHSFDPGWLTARQAWDLAAGDEAVTAIRSNIVLPPNPRYEDRATQIITRPAPRPADVDDPEVRAAVARSFVLGLTVHDLPLIRTFAPQLDGVRHTTWLAPFGAHMGLDVPGASLECLAVIHRQWRPEWTLQVWSAQHSLEIAFTPSYVHAGSAVATLRGPKGTQVFGPFPHNGYEREWLHLHEVVTEGAELRYDADTVVADLTYTLTVADGAAERARQSALPAEDTRGTQTAPSDDTTVGSPA